VTTELARVADWLQPEAIHLDVPLRDARHALDFIATEVAARHDLDAAPVFRALWRREQAGSTALGGGFAVPHARIPGIARPLTLMLRARAPIAFEAPDREPVWLVLGILAPAHGDTEDHLRLLGLVAELFSAPDFRARMDGAADAASAAAAFRAGIARLQEPRAAAPLTARIGSRRLPR